MQSKKKHSSHFNRTKRYSNKRNKLKKIQRGGTRNKILVEIAPRNWQDARAYQKFAFREFLRQYQHDYNPDTVYYYDRDNIRFQVFGEIYIVKEDGSTMRIKSVQVPDGTPEPDYDNEPMTTHTDNSYYFVTSAGDYYFNDRINKEINTNKTSNKEFIVRGGVGVGGEYEVYRVILNQKEVDASAHASRRIIEVGTLHTGGNIYKLFYTSLPGKGGHWQDP